jgi:hypothetical protein
MLLDALKMARDAVSLDSIKLSNHQTIGKKTEAETGNDSRPRPQYPDRPAHQEHNHNDHNARE